MQDHNLASNEMMTPTDGCWTGSGCDRICPLLRWQVALVNTHHNWRHPKEVYEHSWINSLIYRAVQLDCGSPPRVQSCWGESIYWPLSDSSMKSLTLFWLLASDCFPVDHRPINMWVAILVRFILLFWTRYTRLVQIQQDMNPLVCPDTPGVSWRATVEGRAAM